MFYRQYIIIDRTVGIPLIYAVDKPTEKVTHLLNANIEFATGDYGAIVNTIFSHVTGFAYGGERGTIASMVRSTEGNLLVRIPDKDIYADAERLRLLTPNLCPYCGNLTLPSECSFCDNPVSPADRVTAPAFAREHISDCHKATVVWHAREGYVCCECGEECEPQERKDKE